MKGGTDRLLTEMSQFAMFRTIFTILMFISSVVRAEFGNLVLLKPSTCPEGNNDGPLCCKPAPFWQVDLLGYYDIHNITIRTCWGSWGRQAKSAAVEVFFSDPTICSVTLRFLYAKLPAHAKKEQSYIFKVKSPFPVRFLRVSATVQKFVSVREVMAAGSRAVLSKTSVKHYLR